MSCKLCNPEKITKWYNIDSKYWYIFDCVTCRVPMLVLKRHSMEPIKEEIYEAETIHQKYFLGKKWRKIQRLIPDHLHWHLI